MTDNEQPKNVTEPTTDAPSPSPAHPSGRTRKKPLNWKRVGANTSILVFALVVLIFVGFFIDRAFIDPPVKPEISSGGKTRTIQLDVLNGSGTAKIGQQFTDYLRARGFDVVEMGNYRELGVQFTKVIDRTGDMTAARQVAEALGVPKERVVQQLDRNLYLDVSVVIGKDFRTLKPLK